MLGNAVRAHPGVHKTRLSSYSNWISGNLCLKMLRPCRCRILCHLWYFEALIRRAASWFFLSELCEKLLYEKTEGKWSLGDFCIQKAYMITEKVVSCLQKNEVSILNWIQLTRMQANFLEEKSLHTSLDWNPSKVNCSFKELHVRPLTLSYMLLYSSDNTGFIESRYNSFLEKPNRRLMKTTDSKQTDGFKLKGRERRMRNKKEIWKIMKQ